MPNQWGDTAADKAARISSVHAAINALPARRGTDRPDSIVATTDLLPGAYGIVLQAAKERRMSTTAYLRRAALAMACHDLGIPFSDAMDRDPRVTRETGFAVNDPQGTKFGLWEIETLVGEVENDADGTDTA